LQKCVCLTVFCGDTMVVVVASKVGIITDCEKTVLRLGVKIQKNGICCV